MAKIDLTKNDTQIEQETKAKKGSSDLAYKWQLESKQGTFQWANFCQQMYDDLVGKGLLSWFDYFLFVPPFLYPKHFADLDNDEEMKNKMSEISKQDITERYITSPRSTGKSVTMLIIQIYLLIYCPFGNTAWVIKFKSNANSNIVKGVQSATTLMASKHIIPWALREKLIKECDNTKGLEYQGRILKYLGLNTPADTMNLQATSNTNIYKQSDYLELFEKNRDKITKIEDVSYDDTLKSIAEIENELTTNALNSDFYTPNSDFNTYSDSLLVAKTMLQQMSKLSSSDISNLGSPLIPQKFMMMTFDELIKKEMKEDGTEKDLTETQQKEGVTIVISSLKRAGGFNPYIPYTAVNFINNQWDADHWLYRENTEKAIPMLLEDGMSEIEKKQKLYNLKLLDKIGYIDRTNKVDLGNGEFTYKFYAVLGEKYITQYKPQLQTTEYTAEKAKSNKKVEDGEMSLALHNAIYKSIPTRITSDDIYMFKKYIPNVQYISNNDKVRYSIISITHGFDVATSTTNTNSYSSLHTTVIVQKKIKGVAEKDIIIAYNNRKWTKEDNTINTSCRKLFETLDEVYLDIKNDILNGVLDIDGKYLQSEFNGTLETPNNILLKIDDSSINILANTNNQTGIFYEELSRYRFKNIVVSDSSIFTLQKAKRTSKLFTKQIRDSYFEKILSDYQFGVIAHRLDKIKDIYSPSSDVKSVLRHLETDNKGVRKEASAVSVKFKHLSDVYDAMCYSIYSYVIGWEKAYSQIDYQSYYQNLNWERRVN